MTVLADRYELGEPLGAGGMASVVVGHDRLLDRTVAVKLLDRTVDGSARQRFLGEARAAARLHHVNAVQVFDTGEHDGRPYIVMEYVRGRSVADLLASGQGIDIEEAVAITLGVLAALAAAHEVRILHRDVKPANVLLPDDGGVKLADFGIAKATGDATLGLTATGALVGTPSYLAPELVEGREASPASDLYSVGCMLYQLLTGAPPFVGDTAISVAYAHTRMDPAPVTDKRPDVPDDLAVVVMRALAKDPADRFASAEEMSRALLDGPEPQAPAGATLPMAVLASEGPDGSASDQPTVALRSSDVAVDEPRRRGLPLPAIAAIAALVVLAAIVIALMRANGDEQAGDEPGEQADVGVEDEDGDPAEEAQPDDAPGDEQPDDTPGSDDPADAPADDPTADDPTEGDPATDDDPAGDGQDGADPLGNLMGRLASAGEDEFGEKQEDLLDDLREVIRASSREERIENAQELRADLAEWVEKGEIDPDIAAEADAFLAQLIADG